jgi:dihydrofolate synthase / folylpolyglutamate synthase
MLRSLRLGWAAGLIPPISLHPVLSVITNIGHDHMEFLGDTLKAVAGEKAGIIKEGVPVVIGETQDETRDVFLQRAEEMNAPLTFADQRFRCRLGLGFYLTVQ